jgi:ATP-dependent DNA helicase DinG
MGELERAFGDYRMDIERILGPKGTVSQHLTGYEFRPQQIEAALAIERALGAKQHCLAEAGTGVGKSMAYLIPAVSTRSPARRSSSPRSRSISRRSW